MKKTKGMTLFIAIVIMSILLFISFAVVNISLKGTLFATLGRDSQYAFYAADAGIECALFWDSKSATGSAFATSTENSIVCAGLVIQKDDSILGTTTLARIGGGGNVNPTSVFGLKFNLTGNNPMNSCAVVTVKKYYVGSNLVTYIKSRGYNTCDASSLRRLERGVEVTY